MELKDNDVVSFIYQGELKVCLVSKITSGNTERIVFKVLNTSNRGKDHSTKFGHEYYVSIVQGGDSRDGVWKEFKLLGNTADILEKYGVPKL